MKIETVDNEEFLQAQESNRHKELINSLKSLTIAINQPKEDGIIVALTNQTKKIEQFTEVIKSIQKPDAPIVNITTDQKDVINAVIQLGTDIISALNEIKNILNIPKEQKEWEFKIKRSHSGSIESVTAKIK